MKRRPPRSTLSSSSAASDVYKRQPHPTRPGLARRRDVVEDGERHLRDRTPDPVRGEDGRWSSVHGPATRESDSVHRGPPSRTTLQQPLNIRWAGPRPATVLRSVTAPIVDATPGTGFSRVQRTVVGEPAYRVLAELYLDSKQA